MLWLGAGDLTNENGDRANAAASFWQRQFIENVALSGKSIVTVAHVVKARWPKSEMFVHANHASKNACLWNQVGYVNFSLSWIKNLSLIRSYLRAVNELVDKRGAPDLVISYNIFPHTLSILKKLKYHSITKFYLIMADRPHPSLFPPSLNYTEIYKQFSGVAFLSWHVYTEFSGNRSIKALHFEGGVKERKLEKKEAQVSEYPSSLVLYKKSTIVVMFCGSAGDHAGLGCFLESAKYVTMKNVEFWIAGGWSGRIGELNCGSVKIRILGFLSEEELELRLASSDIFVNVNKQSSSQNKHNFPSKLLRYLSFKKPIISTWTEGLSPGYRAVINVLISETAENLAETIDNIIGRTEKEAERERRTLATFVENLCWQRRVQDFLTWAYES